MESVHTFLDIKLEKKNRNRNFITKNFQCKFGLIADIFILDRVYECDFLTNTCLCLRFFQRNSLRDGFFYRNMNSA